MIWSHKTWRQQLKVAQIGVCSTSCNTHPLAGLGGNELNMYFRGWDLFPSTTKLKHLKIWNAKTISYGVDRIFCFWRKYMGSPVNSSSEQSYQGPNEDVGFWAMSCMRNPQVEIWFTAHLVISNQRDQVFWGYAPNVYFCDWDLCSTTAMSWASETLKWSLVVLTESFCLWRKYTSTSQRTHPIEHATKVHTLTRGPEQMPVPEKRWS